MKGFILAVCCVAVAATFPVLTAAQSTPVFHDRPPPVTEPSVVLPAPPAPAAPVAKAKPHPKSIARRVPPPSRPSTAVIGPVRMPSPDVLVMMVRGVLAGVNQANFTGNYSVLHELTTPALQARVTEAQFGKAFTNLRKQNLDLSPALMMAPQFMEAPSMTPQGTLKLVGYVPTRPLQINFAIIYVPVDGMWRIDALTVAALKASVMQPMASAAPTASAQSQPTKTP